MHIYTSQVLHEPAYEDDGPPTVYPMLSSMMVLFNVHARKGILIELLVGAQLDPRPTESIVAMYVMFFDLTATSPHSFIVVVLVCGIRNGK
jgi:hypothetical protein